jgi:hypothetical protein
MDELPARGRYHPFEEIAETLLDDGEPAHLTDAESARTIVEVRIFLLAYWSCHSTPGTTQW